jgi:hemolysin activation/secretion protein
MTPTTPLQTAHWRVAAPAALLAMAAHLQPALAQTAPPPGAGQLLEESRRQTAPALPPRAPARIIDAPVRPTVNMPEGLTVTPSAFRISGAVSFDADTLSALVKPWVGRRLDINGLNEATGAITRHYQGAGHLLSYAYLPAQRVADGVIEIAVLEGRVDAVQVVAAQDARLHDDVVQAHTARLTDPGPLLQPQVERALLLLNDIPGVAARAAFTPGASPGAADLVVTVAESEPLDLRFDISNHGGVSTGEYRAGLTLQLRDLFGRGDATTARGLVSNQGSLVSGTLATTLPLGGDGWRGGVSLSRLTYQLAGSFKPLVAVGTADTFGLDASYALRRSVDNNVYAKASYEHKRLRDELRRLGTSTRKRDELFELTGSADYRDDWGGVSAGSVTATLGKLAQGGVRSEWRRMSAQLARQQAISGNFSAYLRLAGQTTGTALDSSEKLGLGGPGAVRAYAAGEASVDRGYVAALEARYTLDYLGGNLVWSLFKDAAGGDLTRGATTADNRVHLSGAGLGLSWQGPGLGLNASLAWRGARLPTADHSDPQPRLFLQLFYTP